MTTYSAEMRHGLNVAIARWARLAADRLVEHDKDREPFNERGQQEAPNAKPAPTSESKPAPPPSAGSDHLELADDADRDAVQRAMASLQTAKARATTTWSRCGCPLRIRGSSRWC